MGDALFLGEKGAFCRLADLDGLDPQTPTDNLSILSPYSISVGTYCAWSVAFTLIGMQVGVS